MVTVKSFNLLLGVYYGFQDAPDQKSYLQCTKRPDGPTGLQWEISVDNKKMLPGT